MSRILESKLYEVAEEGNRVSLLELIQRDRLLLDRVLVNCTIETPLHVATILGHTDFVREIIHRKPEFATILDSSGSSPLHLASAKGYVEIVKELLLLNPDMCLVRDSEERNPLHLAAMKGHVEVLMELMQARPQAARVTGAWGETILHVCVKYGQLECLKLLVGAMDREFVNAKDDYGMTILHLAVSNKQIEMVKFLLSYTDVEVNAVNANGFTALDVLAQSRRHLKDFDIAEALRAAGARRAADNSRSEIGIARIPTRTPTRETYTVTNIIKQEDWLTKKRDALMVVASLIATMAFQAAITPPGGLWQDDSETNTTVTSKGNNGTEPPHVAGTSILAYKNQHYYGQYLAYNTTSFIASLSIILLLITGLPFRQRFFMWIMTVIVWIAITSIALTYRVSLLVFTPATQEVTVTHVLDYALKVWCGVMAFVFLLHSGRLTANFFKKLENLLGKRIKPPPPLMYPPLA